MSTVSPRCHLCLQLKTPRAGGGLTCEHCDTVCTASADRRHCEACKQGDKSTGRGPSGSLS